MKISTGRVALPLFPSHRQLSWIKGATLLVILVAVSSSVCHAMVPLKAHFVNAAITVFDQPHYGLNYAFGLAVDSSGNVYVADSAHSTIVVESYSNGTYTQRTLAGGLLDPHGVAVDESGNVYIADSGNNRVLKETLSGGSYVESTIGTGLSAPYGLAVDAGGNLYISDAGSGYGNGRVLKETLSGGSYTQALVANFVDPFGIAVDASGNLYVADRGSNRVFKEAPAGEGYIQSLITNNVIAPHGVIVDRQGNVYVADAFNHRVLLETWNAGSGTYSESVFMAMSEPHDLVFDASGNLWVADGGNGIVEIQMSMASFGAVNAGSPSSTATITFAFDIPGTLGSVKVMTEGAPALDFADAGTGTCAAVSYNAGDTCTVNVTFTPSVAGTRNGAVLLEAASGYVGGTGYLAGLGIGPQVAFLPGPEITVAATGLNRPRGVAVDGSGNVYIADTWNSRILKETLVNGTYVETVVTSDGLAWPYGVAVDASGNVYVVDTFNSRVLKETPSGSGYTETTIGENLWEPEGVAIDPTGNVYIADSENNRILKETLTNGAYVESVVAASGLVWPYGVAVDAVGNVFVTDTVHNRILKETFSGSGYIETEIASGLDNPDTLVIDGMGNLYVASNGSSDIVKLSPSGTGYAETILPLVGLNSPYGVAVDGSGNLYIADTANNRVLKEGFATPPTLNFGSIDVGSTSGPQTVTMENIGNAPLVANGAGIDLSTGFTLLAGHGNPPDCESPALAAGASCNLNIAFTPEGAGSYDGSRLLLIDNTLNQSFSTQFIMLNGIANDTGPLPTATQLVFSSSLPATVAAGRNLGTVSVSAEDGSGNLIASFEGSVELVIEDPNEDVVYDQTMQATEGVAAFDLSETALSITGEYAITAESSGLTLARATFQVVSGRPIVPGAGMSGQAALFDPTAVGQSTSRTVTLNISSSITLSRISAGGDYTITEAGGCALHTLLTSSDTCTVTIRFSPSLPGQRWSPLVVTDDEGTKYSFGLAGFATGAAVGFPPGWASLFAGDGDSGYSGDGGPANQAALSWPEALARDGDGNFYIADADNHVIRKVDAAGIITTVAGNGQCDNTGDGGPATSASLCEPSDVAVDAAGILYISDYDNNVVRKVDLNGIITRFAGTGEASFSGDGGPATSAALAGPTSVAADATGNLYIADGYNYRIRKVQTDGTISTYAGNGNDGNSGDGGLALDASIGYPYDVELDSLGNVYVSDPENAVVRKIDSEGVIGTIAGTGESGYGGDGGPATQAQLNAPTGMAISTAGEFFITDSFNCVIRKVDLQGVISTVAGVSCAGEMEKAASRIQKSARLPKARTPGWASPRKSLARPLSETFGPPMTQIPFYFPVDVALDPAGNLFVLDAAYGIVAKGNLETAPPIDFGGVAVGQTGEPAAVAVSNTGNANLEFSQISVAANFNLVPQEGDCAVGTAVSAASACALHVEFAPADAAGISGSVVLSDNGINSSQTVNLAGEGLAVPASPDFGITMAVPSMAVISGEGGTVGLTMNPTGGFAGTVSLSCSGLPAHSTCSFSPASLDALGDNASLSSTMTITTGVAELPARLKSGNRSPLGVWTALSTIGLLFFVPGSLRRKRDWRRLIGLFVLITGLSAVIACGSGQRTTPPASPLTPVGNYSVTVTALSGSTTHSSVITLVVQ